MVVNITRGKDEISVCPDNIVCIRKASVSGSKYIYSCVSTSGDTIYLSEEEMEKVREALRLRDEQLDKLIKNTTTIINELNTLNSTSNQISSNTAGTKQNTGATYNQSQENGRILSSIKNVCDNILSWVRNHYPYPKP